MIELIPQAIINKPIKYFSDNFEINFLRTYDDLDWFEGVVLDLSDKIEYALRCYQGQSDTTTTIYLPHEHWCLDKITATIREILTVYNLTEKDLMWERKDGEGFACANYDFCGCSNSNNGHCMYCTRPPIEHDLEACRIWEIELKRRQDLI